MTAVIIFLLAVLLFGLFEETIYYFVNRYILEYDKPAHPFAFLQRKLRVKNRAS